MKAIVAERGQVTIPKALREKLGIRPGTVLEFELAEGRLVVRKQSAEEIVASVVGCLAATKTTTDEFIKQIRDDI